MIRRALILSTAMLAVATQTRAQSEPYRVFDTRPVITDGPYLVATGETTATVVWFTDTPSHAKLRYGLASELSAVAEPQVDGLVPVGTRHVVHLSNLSPGTTYSYEVVATRVVKLNAYWPDKGLDVRGGPYQGAGLLGGRFMARGVSSSIGGGAVRRSSWQPTQPVRSPDWTTVPLRID